MAAQPKLPPITEAEFQWQVAQLARLRGWHCYHVFDARKSEAGWPDLVAARAPGPGRRGRIIFAELKRDRKARPTPAQKAWLELLRAAGGEVYLWCPEMWREIEEALE